MRKEIPLFITGLVGIVLILQYFSPNKSINGLEGIFTNWMQIIAAFSMILGVLNLIRVNGDKIYKKRKNWKFSIVIVVSLFATLIIGFANIGGKSMYNRKILRTNGTVVGNITKDVMLQNGFKVTNANFGIMSQALVDATQKEKTISSILPKSLKTGALKAKFDKMLPIVRTRSYKSIKIVNNIGRQVNVELASSLKKMNSQSFNESILSVYDNLEKTILENNKNFKLENKNLIDENIKAQLAFLFKNIDTANPSLKDYKDIKIFITEFNDFLSKDKELIAKLDENIKSSKSYNDFYKKSSVLFSLKQDNKFNKFLLKNILDTYLNNIYVSKNYLNAKNNIAKALSENKDLINAIALNIEDNLTNKYTKDFKKYVSNIELYVGNNKYVKDSSIIKATYKPIIAKLYTVEKREVANIILTELKSPALLKKLKVNQLFLTSLIKNSKSEVTVLGISDKSSKFIMQKLLEGGGDYKLYTLEVGSSFMEIYRYIFTPLSSTMFALLAFFVASASYRAFRARNKEATLLLVAGFLVMLGAVPIGEMLSIKGVFSVAEVSDFIMNVPVMSVQSGIMIGVALGVISTSLRLILGIERSHLGGD